MVDKTKGSIFNLIDLSYQGLEEVKDAVENNKINQAIKLLKEYYISRKQPVLFMEGIKESEAREHAKNNYKEDIEEILKVSDEVSNNVFLFRFPWDMEKTNIPVTFEKEILWSHIPFKDEEWAFMLNRHRYWVALGQAYWITRDEKYAKTFTKQLEHWIDNNPLDSPSAHITWRSIEAGIRCENWIKSYEYFKESIYFTDELFEKMLLCIYEHCEYLMSRYDYFRHISNWGVLENHGLFEAGVFLSEFKKAKQWQETGIDRLRQCANLQVMKDGVQWEQSPMYHNEVFHCFMDTIILAERNNIELPNDIKDKTQKMAYANLYMAKPNHHQPLQGDSDDTDIRDLLTEAAFICQDGVLKFGAYKTLDFNSFCLFGLKGLEEYEKIKSKTPKNISMALENSGNFVMRSSWEENANYMLFDCGPIGAGHGHCDLLHFDIHAYGRTLLNDIGRYTYMENEPLRDYFKGCKAHNTILVDDTDFIKCGSSWTYEKIATPCEQKWISEDIFDYVEGSHTGYRDLKDPVYPLRRIIFVKPFYWYLIDSFDCKDSHNFKEYFHFVSGQLKINKENMECHTCFENDVNLRIIPVKHEKISAKIETGLYSSEYNLKEENNVLTYSCNNTGFTSMINIIYPERQGERTDIIIEKLDVHTNKGIVSDNFAEAVKVRFQDHNEEHILFVKHSRNYTVEPEVSSTVFYVDESFIRGEVVLIKRKGEKEEVILIK